VEQVVAHAWEGSNFYIAAGGNPAYRKPFGFVLVPAKNKEWGALGDDFRTSAVTQILANGPRISEMTLLGRFG